MQYSQEEISQFVSRFLENSLAFAAAQSTNPDYMSDVNTLTRLGYQDEAKLYHEAAIGLGFERIDLIADLRVVRQRTALILAAAGKDQKFNIGRYLFWSCLGKVNQDFMDANPVSQQILGKDQQPVPGLDVRHLVEKLVTSFKAEKK